MGVWGFNHRYVLGMTLFDNIMQLWPNVAGGFVVYLGKETCVPRMAHLPNKKGPRSPLTAFICVEVAPIGLSSNRLMDSIRFFSNI